MAHPISAAYTRGIAACLADTGIVKFASDAEANAIADATAAAISDPGDINDIVKAATDGAGENNLALEAGEVGSLAGAIGNIAGKTAEARVMLTKQANADDMQKLAAHGPTKLAQVNIALAQYATEKRAAAAQGIGMPNPTVDGPLIDGKPTKADTLAVAAKQTPEAGLEAGQRPENYANEGEEGVGTTPTNIGMGAGMMGEQQPFPVKPPNSAPTTSEVVSVPAQKAAADMAVGMLTAVKNAQAAKGIGTPNPTVEGPLIDGKPTNPTDLDVAAQQTPEAAYEAGQRPKNYANQGEAGVGQTETNLGEGAGYVGAAVPFPVQAPNTAPQVNQVVSFRGKQAEEYLAHFNKVARIVVPLFPAMSAEEAMPHVHKIAAMKDDEEKANYIAAMKNGDKREAQGESAEGSPAAAEKSEEEEAEKKATARLEGLIGKLSA